LKQGHAAEYAVEVGWARVPTWGTAHDALRCWHLNEALKFFAEDVAREMVKAQKPENPF
jgi:hypothetical protein